jgi:hypothetical protein
VKANDRSEAIQLATDALDGFLQHMSVHMRLTFSAKFILGLTTKGQAFTAPPRFDFANTTYNLDQLKKAVEDAQRYVSLQDEQLLRSLQYFEHASWLFERRNRLADFGSRHFTFLISSIFLNLWKAASVIVGDPSVDRDYQRRYRDLGLDRQFFRDRIESLRELRNNVDVAHYRLSPVTKPFISSLTLWS